MEYVVVSYQDYRIVRIDGLDAGMTNDTLMVETGTHDFSLAGNDYRPSVVTMVVRQTTSLSPLIITDFESV